VLASGEAANLTALELVEGPFVGRFGEAVEGTVMVEAFTLKVSHRSGWIGFKIAGKRLWAVIGMLSH
jgi:hypothetical protein